MSFHLPICPYCGDELDILINAQSGIAYYEFDGENYELDEVEPDDELNVWQCPECGRNLFYSEDEAIDFLRMGKNE